MNREVEERRSGFRASDRRNKRKENGIGRRSRRRKRQEKKGIFKFRNSVRRAWRHQADTREQKKKKKIIK